MESFHNPASVVKTEVSGGAVRLIASKISSEGNEGYSARISLRHFLTPDGGTHDLTGLKSVDFEFKNSKTITDYMSVSFGSDAYPGGMEKAGTVFEAGISGAADKAASMVWKQASVSVADFSTPKWWTDIPATFPTIDGVLKEVRNIQFEPKTAYEDAGTQNGTACTKCTNPTMDSLTLEIRNIVLVGADRFRFPNPSQIGCTGKSVVLDKTFDDNENEFGGYWFNLSDFDTTGTSTGSTAGSSKSSLELVQGDEFTMGWITLKAELDKMVGSQWHRDAGWAVIGTSIGRGYYLAGELTGIRFRLKVDSLSAFVDGILFKFGFREVPYSVMIPSSALKSGSSGGVDVCIRPEDLKMPYDVITEVETGFFPKEHDLMQLAWETKIANRLDSTFAKADVDFSLGNVALYGRSLGLGVVAVQPRSPSHPFAITYANGTLNLRGLEGITSLDILALGGHRVASFVPASRTPLRLARGTWILAAHRRDGTVATQPFVVAGP